MFDTKDTKQVIGLHVSPGKPNYGHIESGPFRLTFSTAGEPFAEISGPSIELRGYASVFSGKHAQAFLRPSGPLVLAGVFSVAPATLLTVARGAAGELVPGVPDLDILTPKASFEAHPCTDFAIDQAKFDPKSVVPKPTGKPLNKTRWTATDAPIAVTATDSPVATVRGGRKVIEVSRDAGHSLITATTEQGILFGWVATTDLDDQPPGAIGLIGTGSGAGKYGQALSSAKLITQTCSHDVRIAWLDKDAMTFVGRIRAGKSLHYRSQEKIGVLAAFPAGFDAQAGVLAIPLSELVDCKRK